MNVLALAITLLAVTPDSPVKIGVADFAPMIVIDSYGQISGFDYDLFEALAADPGVDWLRGRDYEYVIVHSFDALLNQVASGEIDMALDGISITHQRLESMNFSLPYKNSGQRIMAPYAGEIGFWNHIVTYILQFFRLEILLAFVALIISCLFWGVIIYFVEKLFSSDRCQPNINTIEAGTLASYDAGTTIGYGRFFPVTRPGQLVGAAAFFCGAILVGNVISILTTDKIVSHLEGAITCPEDLKGKTVAVVNGTTSEDVTREYDPGVVIECDDFYKAVVRLRLGEADAVVADDPVVRNYLKNNPTHGSLAGMKFHPEDYGIAFAPNSKEDLIKTFSKAIARIKESGKLALIENQWFGE